MSGHILTAGQRRPRAWLLMALWYGATTAMAQGIALEPEPVSLDPIALSADRIAYWDEGPYRWVLLEDQAAAFQGADGVRAANALARIEIRPLGPTTEYHVEVYAEGDATLTDRPDERHAALRIRHASGSDVQLKAFGEGGIRKLDAPARDHELFLRGFPDAPKPEPEPEPGPNSDVTLIEPDPAEPSAFPVDPARLAAARSAPDAPLDPSVQKAQFDGDEAFPTEGPLFPSVPDSGFSMDEDPSPDLGDTIPLDGGELVPEPELPVIPPAPAGLPDVTGAASSPLFPGTRRVITISPRDSGPNYKIESRPAGDGSDRTIILVRGGVRIVVEEPGRGIIDVSADNAVIWTRLDQNASIGGGAAPSLNTDSKQPFEVYLDGHVVFRQDEQQVAGDGDQKEVLAERFYIDVGKEWFIAERAEVNLFDSRFMTPIKTKGDVVRQYRPLQPGPDGSFLLGPSEIRADRTMVTGSRFPTPGYRIQNRSVDLTQVYEPLIDPYTGRPALDPAQPGAPMDKSWRIDARQNFFFLGPIPVFYWPRLVTDSDDLDPPLRQIQYRYVNYFGHQVLTDWSMFKIFGARKPLNIDDWNFDVDYLSERGTAFGSQIGWQGKDLIGDFTDPYAQRRTGRLVDRPYVGYLNLWGLDDNRFDTLGTGRAVVTNGPPWSQQRYYRDAVPAFQSYRGRALIRHMQSFLPSEAPFDEDFRLQLEAAYISDRHFLEQYYKRLFDSGLDELTLAYLIYQRENQALTLHAEANLLNWQTQGQYFPKLDYYRLGDSLFGDLFTYWGNTGIDYANTATAIEIANPRVFSLLPFDPVSATSGPFRSGRVWTSHELALPLNLGFFRLSPYVQGQFVGWDNQYQDSLPPLTLFPDLPTTAYLRGPQGAQLGRIWGAAGARFNMMAWRIFPGVESEMLNIHGLGHKINFDVNYRNTYSNVDIGRIGIQDNIDDNTYEFVRRYFAMEQYGTILPPQYDPRLLTLRRTISPITGTTDIQDDMHTLDLAIRQRLQTRRGPEGRRRIVDIMTFDLATTYFPQADRDNFGKPFGQNTYNWEWFVGDRTSFQSYGWFEFFDITGDPLRLASPRGTNDPFGLYVITNNISINRPPRGNVTIGYSVINTGPIATSALNVSCSYWLSPKWYSSFGTSYDFGNAILLGSTVGITRIGADWLTSIGLTVDPQRDAYMFGFELTPRLSPSIRFGSGGGVARFDSRFAPVE